MSDRRTRDQLRASNDKLRAAIRHFVWCEEHINDGPSSEGWDREQARQKAIRAMKELMGEASPNKREGKK